ncbi:hypothetical protein [Paenibacillus thermotolerans]|uniref:hypothetical protein n=1 Tax=Paenibacillus thermotolerans TaxID=3027807 RepID=UPI0023675098|nr:MULTISPECIES: hypothetical protein [unclassified Paenibacillus]
MFDPTAFDNWKVVVEGAFYDADREGAIVVVGREDLIDLAGMSRSFRISASLPGQSARAELRLFSGLEDFTAERHAASLNEEPPGIRMELLLTLPGERVKDIAAIHGSIESLWFPDAEIRHSLTVSVDPAQPQAAASPEGSEYAVAMTFCNKWGEDRLSDIDELLRRLIETLQSVSARPA